MPIVKITPHLARHIAKSNSSPEKVPLRHVRHPTSVKNDGTTTLKGVTTTFPEVQPVPESDEPVPSSSSASLRKEGPSRHVDIVVEKSVRVTHEEKEQQNTLQAMETLPTEQRLELVLAKKKTGGKAGAFRRAAGEIEKQEHIGEDREEWLLDHEWLDRRHDIAFFLELEEKERLKRQNEDLKDWKTLVARLQDDDRLHRRMRPTIIKETVTGAANVFLKKKKGPAADEYDAVWKELGAEEDEKVEFMEEVDIWDGDEEADYDDPDALARAVEHKSGKQNTEKNFLTHVGATHGLQDSKHSAKDVDWDTVHRRRMAMQNWRVIQEEKDERDKARGAKGNDEPNSAEQIKQKFDEKAQLLAFYVGVGESATRALKCTDRFTQYAKSMSYKGMVNSINTCNAVDNVRTISDVVFKDHVLQLQDACQPIVEFVRLAKVTEKTELVELAEIGEEIKTQMNEGRNSFDHMRLTYDMQNEKIKSTLQKALEIASKQFKKTQKELIQMHTEITEHRTEYDAFVKKERELQRREKNLLDKLQEIDDAEKEKERKRIEAMRELRAEEERLTALAKQRKKQNDLAEKEVISLGSRIHSSIEDKMMTNTKRMLQQRTDRLKRFKEAQERSLQRRKDMLQRRVSALREKATENGRYVTNRRLVDDMVVVRNLAVASQCLSQEVEARTATIDEDGRADPEQEKSILSDVVVQLKESTNWFNERQHLIQLDEDTYQLSDELPLMKVQLRLAQRIKALQRRWELEDRERMEKLRMKSMRKSVFQVAKIRRDQTVSVEQLDEARSSIKEKIEMEQSQRSSVFFAGRKSFFGGRKTVGFSIFGDVSNPIEKLGAMTRHSQLEQDDDDESDDDSDISEYECHRDLHSEIASELAKEPEVAGSNLLERRGVEIPALTNALDSPTNADSNRMVLYDAFEQDLDVIEGSKDVLAFRCRIWKNNLVEKKADLDKSAETVVGFVEEASEEISKAFQILEPCVYWSAGDAARMGGVFGDVPPVSFANLSLLLAMTSDRSRLTDQVVAGLEALPMSVDVATLSEVLDNLEDCLRKEYLEPLVDDTVMEEAYAWQVRLNKALRGRVALRSACASALEWYWQEGGTDTSNMLKGLNVVNRFLTSQKMESSDMFAKIMESEMDAELHQFMISQLRASYLEAYECALLAAETIEHSTADMSMGLIRPLLPESPEDRASQKRGSLKGRASHRGSLGKSLFSESKSSVKVAKILKVKVPSKVKPVPLSGEADEKVAGEEGSGTPMGKRGQRGSIMSSETLEGEEGEESKRVGRKSIKAKKGQRGSIVSSETLESEITEDGMSSSQATPSASGGKRMTQKRQTTIEKSPSQTVEDPTGSPRSPTSQAGKSESTGSASLSRKSMMHKKASLLLSQKRKTIQSDSTPTNSTTPTSRGLALDSPFGAQAQGQDRDLDISGLEAEGDLTSSSRSQRKLKTISESTKKRFSVAAVDYVSNAAKRSSLSRDIGVSGDFSELKPIEDEQKALPKAFERRASVAQTAGALQKIGQQKRRTSMMVMCSPVPTNLKPPQLEAPQELEEPPPSRPPSGLFGGKGFRAFDEADENVEGEVDQLGQGRGSRRGSRQEPASPKNFFEQIEEELGIGKDDKIDEGSEAEEEKDEVKAPEVTYKTMVKAESTLGFEEIHFEQVLATSTSVLVLEKEEKETADRDVLDRALTSKDGTLIVQCGETKEGCCASDLILWATEHPDTFKEKLDVSDGKLAELVAEWDDMYGQEVEEEEAGVEEQGDADEESEEELDEASESESQLDEQSTSSSEEEAAVASRKASPLDTNEGEGVLDFLTEEVDKLESPELDEDRRASSKIAEMLGVGGAGRASRSPNSQFASSPQEPGFDDDDAEDETPKSGKIGSILAGSPAGSKMSLFKGRSSKAWGEAQSAILGKVREKKTTESGGTKSNALRRAVASVKSSIKLGKGRTSTAVKRRSSGGMDGDLGLEDDDLPPLEMKPRKSMVFGLQLNMDDLEEMDDEAQKQANAAILLSEASEQKEKVKLDDETIKNAGAFFGLSTTGKKAEMAVSKTASSGHIQEAKQRAMTNLRSTMSIRLRSGATQKGRARLGAQVQFEGGEEVELGVGKTQSSGAGLTGAFTTRRSTINVRSEAHSPKPASPPPAPTSPAPVVKKVPSNPASIGWTKVKTIKTVMATARLSDAQTQTPEALPMTKMDSLQVTGQSRPSQRCSSARGTREGSTLLTVRNDLPARPSSARPGDPRSDTSPEPSWLSSARASLLPKDSASPETRPETSLSRQSTDPINWTVRASVWLSRKGSPNCGMGGLLHQASKMLSVNPIQAPAPNIQVPVQINEGTGTEDTQRQMLRSLINEAKEPLSPIAPASARPASARKEPVGDGPVANKSTHQGTDEAKDDNETKDSALSAQLPAAGTNALESSKTLPMLPVPLPPMIHVPSDLSFASGGVAAQHLSVSQKSLLASPSKLEKSHSGLTKNKLERKRQREAAVVVMRLRDQQDGTMKMGLVPREGQRRQLPSPSAIGSLYDEYITGGHSIDEPESPRSLYQTSELPPLPSNAPASPKHIQPKPTGFAGAELAVSNAALAQSHGVPESTWMPELLKALAVLSQEDAQIVGVLRSFGWTGTSFEAPPHLGSLVAVLHTYAAPTPLLLDPGYYFDPLQSAEALLNQPRSTVCPWTSRIHNIQESENNVFRSDMYVVDSTAVNAEMVESDEKEKASKVLRAMAPSPKKEKGPVPGPVAWFARRRAAEARSINSGFDNLMGSDDEPRHVLTPDAKRPFTMQSMAPDRVGYNTIPTAQSRKDKSFDVGRFFHPGASPGTSRVRRKQPLYESPSR